MAYTHLDPGRELEISAHFYFSSAQADLSEMVKLSPEQLKAQEADSVEQEQAIYTKILEIEKEWVNQAGLTASLRKAQEYLKTPATEHTSNQWCEKEYDWYEISNMVYKMTYRIYEGTDYRSSIRPRPGTLPCSQKSPRPSRRRPGGGSVSMGYFSPATPWKPRS